MFVSVVTPIYNDIHTMPRVLPQLVALLKETCDHFECLLIDDASSDGSREWAERYIKGKRALRLISHKKNLGIAQTYRQLYKEAKGDIVVLFSLDGEWDPKDTVRLANSLQSEKLDMVIGIRSKKQYTPWRMIVSTLYNVATRVLFGVKTGDAGSIKAMRKKIISLIPIVSRGVFDEAERIIRAKKMGYRIGFLPVNHKGVIKSQRGIRLRHVCEAVTDMIRVLAI